MLQSEQTERERRFFLALRAGLPVLILAGLLGYHMVFEPTLLETISANIYLLIAVLFIGIYFIYFMIELASSETTLDANTKLFTEKAFANHLQKFKPDFVTILVVDNITTIEEQNGMQIREETISELALTLDDFVKDNISQSYIMSRISNGEIMIATKGNSKINISKFIKQFSKKYKKINNIEIKYVCATTEYHESYDKTHMYLRILLQISSNAHKAPQETDISDKKLESDMANINIEIVSNNTIEALEDRHIIFTYRPILNLANDKVEIYEVFSKLKANDSSEILPKMFLPILNRLGLSKEYDTAIAKHILNILQQTDPSISFEFNISPFSIRDRQFQKQFIKMLKSSNINPSRIIIQLYENKAHHDISSYLKVLEFYRNEGIRICIDNFGLSASSIEYMKNFKFDVIQLDRDFITDIDNHNSKTMLSAILAVSKNSGVTSVAKWVDKPEQKSKLKELGIDYIQGFMVHKPLFENEIIQRHGTKGEDV